MNKNAFIRKPKSKDIMSNNAKIFARILAILFLVSVAMVTNPVSANTLHQNSWAELPPMNVARAWLGVAAVNGEIYAIGGSTASGSEPASFPYGNINLDHFVSTNEEYDPTNRTWSYAAPMPTPRMAFAIATFQGKIYCIGGRSIAGDMAGGYTTVNEVYDPETNSWENKAPMPTANGWIDAKVVDDKIYIRNSIPNTSAGYYVYEPASDTWNDSVSTPIDGKLLLDDIPDGYETTGVMSPMMVYTFNAGFNSNVKAYNPENDSWQNGVASPLDRNGFGVAVANDIFYVVGGYTYSFIGNFAPLTANEAYTPFGYGTPDPSYVLEHTPPQLSFQSPLNQTYNDSSVQIIFTINKNVTWIGYSLDGKQNATLTSNTTIDKISNGSHNVTIYANDSYGNVGIETANFNIEKPEIEIFGTTMTIIMIGIPIVTACLVASILFFRRHRKTKEIEQFQKMADIK